jgi:hypothetical protein
MVNSPTSAGAELGRRAKASRGGLRGAGRFGQAGVQPFADFVWGIGAPPPLITTPVAATPAKAASPSTLSQRICLG